MAILKAKITIVGTRPMFMHKFGPDALPLEKVERQGVAGNNPAEWRSTYTATADGQLYIPPENVFACIRDGARFTKRGRGTLQGAVASTLQVADAIVLLNRRMPDGDPTTDPSQPVYLDVRGVRNPASKARNVRYRIAISSGWEATFTLMFENTVVSRNELEAIVGDAGVLCGLGDGRSIGLGRFSVTKFEIVA